MKSADDRLDELFKAAKEIPTELPLDSVESFISSLPDLDATPNNNGGNYFTIKNLLIVSVPVILLSTIYFFNATEHVEYATVSSTQKVQEIKVIDTVLASSTVLGSRVPDLPRNDEQEAFDTKVEAKPVGIILDERAPILYDTSKPLVVPDLNLTLDSFKRPVTNRSLASLPVKEKIIEEQVSETQPPNLSDGQMRRLKKTLYKSLYSDGLIPSDTSSVFLKLPGEKVLINDIRLNDALAQTYSKLTSIAGYGKYRGIKLSSTLILVGDFIENEFKGSGVGLFPPKPIDTSGFLELEKSADRLDRQVDLAFGFSDEWQKLNAFAEEVLAEAAIQQGKRRILSVDRNGQEMNVLYQMLQGQLRKDGLIASAADYVILGLGEDAIFLNGKPMSPEHETEYRAIFAAQGIKTGAYRMIRMNDKVIGVGDFKKAGEFKGTIWSITQ